MGRHRSSGSWSQGALSLSFEEDLVLLHEGLVLPSGRERKLAELLNIPITPSMVILSNFPPFWRQGTFESSNGPHSHQEPYYFLQPENPTPIYTS